MREALKTRIALMRGQLEGRQPVNEVHVSTQLFITSGLISQQLVELADLRNEHLILEPSAGTGALLRAALAIAPDAQYEAVEMHGALYQQLRKEFPSVTTFNDDFLCFKPGHYYDRIIMNPPFNHGADIRHIMHARTLLKPGGNLVAICADGPRQRSKLVPLAGYLEPLPPGTFAYTNVSTMMLQIFAT